MRTLRFDVAGIPKPKGSLKHVGRGRLVEQVDNKAWKRAVLLSAATFRDMDGWETATGPVTVTLNFTIPRLKSAKKRRAPITRSSGDIDKLTRLVFDCLTDAKIIGDDSQVVSLYATKAYGDQPGVTVYLHRAEPVSE